MALDACASGPGQLLIALDGTAYHSSPTIHCPQCTRIEHQNGSVSYQHTVITPVIVTPTLSRVIPLAPEFIVPQDGHDKQDCETAAAKRWLTTAAHYRDQHVTVLGDDLYSRPGRSRQAGLRDGGGQALAYDRRPLPGSARHRARRRPL
nr:hypothetical protein [Acidiferrobacter sp. SPIII_3]